MVTARALVALAVAGAAAGGCAIVVGLEDKSLLDETDAASPPDAATAPDVVADAPPVTPPEIVVSDLRRPSGVAVDVSHVYFAEEGAGRIQRLRKGEASPVLVAKDQRGPRQILLDSQTVYWRSVNDPPAKIDYPSICRLDKSKDAMTPCNPLWNSNGMQSNVVRGIALWEPTDGSNENLLFFTRDDRVQKKPRSNFGNDSDVANAQSVPAAVAVDATHVYWASEGDYTIRRRVKDPVSLDGGPPPPVEKIHASTDGVFALGLALDDESLYWLDQLGRIFKIEKAKSGGAATLLAQSDSTPIGEIALSDDAVFWTNYERGTVSSVPKAGPESAKRVLAGAQDKPRGIAFDRFDTPKRIYWTTEGALMRFTP